MASSPPFRPHSGASDSVSSRYMRDSKTRVKANEAQRCRREEEGGSTSLSTVPLGAWTQPDDAARLAS